MSDVNYLLFFTGDSDSGGAEASVRGFYSIDAARAAMREAYEKMAEAVRLPAPLGAYCDRYTVKRKHTAADSWSCSPPHPSPGS